jgi:hypothetical protein
VVETALGVIKGIIQVVTGLIRGDWKRVWEGIKQIFSSVWNGIKNIVRLAIAAVKNVIDTGLSTIRAVFTIGWDAIKRIFSTALEVIKRTVSTALNAIVEFARKMPGRIGQAVSGLWNALMTGLSFVKQWISDRLDDIVGFITGLPSRIADAASGMFDGIKEAFRSAINFIIRGWNSLEFTLPKVDTHIPGVGKIGGWTLGTPDIKPLAGGGVITRPTLALLGEHTRALPEIVTPERLLKSIIDTSLAKNNEGDTFNFEFSFGDLTTPEAAAEVRRTVTSGPVLKELVRAVRAGRVA